MMTDEKKTTSKSNTAKQKRKIVSRPKPVVAMGGQHKNKVNR